MQSVSTFFKEENDLFYRRGEAKGQASGEIKGEEKKSRIVIESLILKLGFTDEQVAEVDINFVRKVRADLKKK